MSTLVFTLGSIYSTKTSGTEQTTETNNSNETQQGQESYLKPDGYLQVSIDHRKRSQPRILSGFRNVSPSYFDRNTIGNKNDVKSWLLSPYPCLLKI